MLVTVKLNVARVSTTYTTSDQDEYDTLNEFNMNENLNILLLDRLPMICPRNVTHLHILDGNLEDALVLIDALFKDTNYDTGMDTILNVHLHCSSDNGKMLSSDVKFAFDKANMESFVEVVNGINESRQIRYDAGKFVNSKLNII